RGAGAGGMGCNAAGARKGGGLVTVSGLSHQNPERNMRGLFRQNGRPCEWAENPHHQILLCPQHLLADQLKKDPPDRNRMYAIHRSMQNRCAVWSGPARQVRSKTAFL